MDDYRQVLKELTLEGFIPKGMKVRVRSKDRTLQVISLGDLVDKFGQDIALLSIGVAIQALKTKLPGWRISTGYELEMLWEKDKSRLGVLPLTGNQRLDYRNHVTSRLPRYKKVYEYARYLQRVHGGEDALAEDEARVPVLKEPPITPGMDKKRWTHFMPIPTYEKAIQASTAVARSPEEIVSYQGKYYYPR